MVMTLSDIARCDNSATREERIGTYLKRFAHSEWPLIGGRGGQLSVYIYPLFSHAWMSVITIFLYFALSIYLVPIVDKDGFLNKEYKSSS
jgi:hypothetical protein